MKDSAMRFSTMSCWSIVLLLLCSIPVCAQVPWTGILDPSRATDWTNVGATIPTGNIPDCSVQPATPVTIATINAAISADAGGSSYCKINIPAGTYTAANVVDPTNQQNLGDPVNGMINIKYAGAANIVLNGAGANQTFLVWSGANTGASRCNWGPHYKIEMCLFNGLNQANGGAVASYGRVGYGSYQGNLVAITGGASAGAPLTQGSTQITLASLKDQNPLNTNPGSLLQGQIIQIEQLDPITDNGNAWFCQTVEDGNTHRPCSQQGDSHSPVPPQGNSTQNQLFIVKACGATADGQPCKSTTITLNTPIRAPNWSLSQTPQAAWQSAMPLSNVGIQNMTIDSSAATDQPIMVSCSECSNVWFSGIRTINGTIGGQSGTNHLSIGQSNHVTVQNSYLYGANPAAEGYAVDFLWGTSDSLAINNITQHLPTGFINETGVGDVFAYNYSVDAYFGSNWQSCSEFEHGAGDSELLYEGNIGICHSADDIHGNHAWNTLYRDYLSGFDPSTTGGARQDNTFAFADMYGSRYYNLVGSVLGTVGTTVNYENAGTSEVNNGVVTSCGPGYPQFAVYSLDFSDQNQTLYAQPCYQTPSSLTIIDNDPLVKSTLVRWANWDSVNGSVQENASETASNAPVYPGLASPATTFPASFFLNAKPSWWIFPKGTVAPWPAIGPDVAGGNIANAGGHAWLNPAANCYLNVMGGKDGSDGTSTSYTFDPLACYSTAPAAATPVISLATGAYTGAQSVTITDSTAGAAIYYTTDGSTPSAQSTLYSGAITVSDSETLSAIALVPGIAQSAIASAKYTISLPTVSTPTFSPAAGTYSSAQSVTINVSTPGVTIHYTTDGTAPTANSPLYETPINVANSMTLQAVATATGILPSAVGTAAYTISSASPTIKYIQGTQLPYPTGKSYTPCYYPGTSGATCAPMTLTSPTTAGDLLVVVASDTGYQGAQTNIQSIACTDGSGDPMACTWVLPGAACQNFNSTGGGGVDCAYILSAPGGISSVTVTMSGTTKYGTAYLREYSTTAPSGFRFDNVTTAINNTCDSCATPSLSLFGTNDVVIALGSPGNQFTAIAAPYGDVQTEPNQTGSIIGDVLNTSSGAGATVSGNANGPTSLLTLAFTDSPAPPAPAATPTFSVAAGTYTFWQIVKITDATKGATIYYTVDGSSPTTSSPVYGKPLAVLSSQTVRAIAVASGNSPSAVATANYVINIEAAPTFSPAPGPYASAQIVAIGDSDPNATIYYTTDGSTPTTASALYGTPFIVPAPGTNIPASVVVRAIATAPNYGASAVSSAAYTIGGTGTISLVQESVLENNQGNSNFECGPTCPAFSIQPTGAGDLLFLSAVGTGDLSASAHIASIACADASGNSLSCTDWVRPGTTGCQVDRYEDGTDCAYLLSAPAGVTSVTVTLTSPIRYGTVYFREYRTMQPTGFRYDTSATSFTAGASDSPTGPGCDSCVTPTLTLTGANDVLIAGGVPSNGFTGIAAPYGNMVAEPWTTTLIGDVLNTSSGAGATLTGNGTGNAATTFTVAFTDTPVVTATPEISLASGTYTAVQSVTITDSTLGATIYYTTDGSTPTTSSAKYSGAIAVVASETLNAIAVNTGSKPSDAASATYTINLPPAATPTFTPDAGTFPSAQNVAIGDATAGATIYYTTDGSTPTISSSVYRTPIAVSAANETIKAIAIAYGYSSSAVASASYSVIIPNPVPAIGNASPAIATAGGTAFSITVNGSGFLSSSVIYWGSTALTTQFTSASQLTAQVPASAISTAGITAITVQSPAPGGGTSNTFNFEVDSAATGAAPNFSTTSATVVAGSSVVYPVTLPSTITEAFVNCLNLPAGARCSYSPTSGALTIGTSSATPVGTYKVTVVFTEGQTGASAALVLFPLLILPAYRARKKLKNGMFLMIVGLATLLSTGLLLTGCGGAPKSGISNPVTSSAVVTLTVQ